MRAIYTASTQASRLAVHHASQQDSKMDVIRASQQTDASQQAVTLYVMQAGKTACQHERQTA